nr:hypothetical protein [Methanocella arvoryzae]
MELANLPSVRELVRMLRSDTYKMWILGFDHLPSEARSSFGKISYSSYRIRVFRMDMFKYQ